MSHRRGLSQGGDRLKLAAVFASSESHGNTFARALANAGPSAISGRATPHWLSASSNAAAGIAARGEGSADAVSKVFPVELGFRAGLRPGFITELHITAHQFCVPKIVKVYVSDPVDAIDGEAPSPNRRRWGPDRQRVRSNKKHHKHAISHTTIGSDNDDDDSLDDYGTCLLYTSPSPRDRG